MWTSKTQKERHHGVTLFVLWPARQDSEPRFAAEPAEGDFSTYVAAKQQFAAQTERLE